MGNSPCSHYLRGSMSNGADSSLSTLRLTRTVDDDSDDDVGDDDYASLGYSDDETDDDSIEFNEIFQLADDSTISESKEAVKNK